MFSKAGLFVKTADQPGSWNVGTDWSEHNCPCNVHRPPLGGSWSHKDLEFIIRVEYLLCCLHFHVLQMTSCPHGGGRGQAISGNARKSWFILGGFSHLPCCPQAAPSCWHSPSPLCLPQPSRQPHSQLKKTSLKAWFFEKCHWWQNPTTSTHPPSGFAHTLSPCPEQTEDSNSMQASKVPLLQSTWNPNRCKVW